MELCKDNIVWNSVHLTVDSKSVLHCAHAFVAIGTVIDSLLKEM